MDLPITRQREQNHNLKAIQQWVQVAILAGLGAYFVYNIYSGNLANYINERFVWLSYVAAILFFTIATFSAFRTVRGVEISSGLSENMNTVTWSVIITAAMPLIFGTMIPSQPLGVEAVNGNISTSAVVGVSENTFAIAPENRNILDWLREFNSSTDYDVFNGQPANVSGFVYREPDFAENQFMVARFTVSCCVADASALGLPVFADNAGEFETGEWVQVGGTVQVDEFTGEVLPIINSSNIERIELPEHPYLYP
ncbi:MAG: TIGR03943 family protein [Chloroflexota bacterium]